MSTQPRRRNSGSFITVFCGPCDMVSEHCGRSIIFLGFVGFYIMSFLWDIFVLWGGGLTLPISQINTCVARSGLYDISPVFVLCMLFIAVFHAVSLCWIIGFIHSRQINNRRDWFSGGFQIVDVPDQFCHSSICIPFLCFDLLMIINFGLSLYVYLFLANLIENEPEAYVDQFCIDYETTEEAYDIMQLSLIFFILTAILGCVYCCLIRIATNDISYVQPGQQQFIVQSPRSMSPNVHSPQQRPLNAPSSGSEDIDNRHPRHPRQYQAKPKPEQQYVPQPKPQQQYKPNQNGQQNQNQKQYVPQQRPRNIAQYAPRQNQPYQPQHSPHNQ